MIDVQVEHLCYARGCKTVAYRVMCRHHWEMLPAVLRVPILTYYQPNIAPREHQSAAFHRALNAACLHIAALETRPPRSVPPSSGGQRRKGKRQ